MWIQSSQVDWTGQSELQFVCIEHPDKSPKNEDCILEKNDIKLGNKQSRRGEIPESLTESWEAITEINENAENKLKSMKFFICHFEQQCRINLKNYQK